MRIPFFLPDTCNRPTIGVYHMSHVFQTFRNSQILLVEPGIELFADEAELLVDDVVQPLESTLDLAQPFVLLLLRHHVHSLLRSYFW